MADSPPAPPDSWDALPPADTYSRFLETAASVLAAEGGQVLLPPGAQPLPWARGWDQIILVGGPGPTTLYAFTLANPVVLECLVERVENLARGLSEREAPTRGPVHLVAVVSLPPGTPPAGARSVARVAPRTYYPGLHPTTWAVDLGSGVLTTSRRIGKPERAGIITVAAHTAARGGTVDPLAVERSRAEARLRSQAFYDLIHGRRPYVTYGLIAVNVAIFLWMYLQHGLASDGGIPGGVLKSAGALSGSLVLRHGQWYRLLTAVFLHASVQHILFNMTSLFAVGVLAERLYGSLKFLAIYLGAGLLGSLTSVTYGAATGQLDVLGVGASGAIFGVAGALISVRFQQSDVIPEQLRRRVSNAMLPLVALSLLIAYVTPYVDNAAHLGGLLGGILLSFLFPLARHIPAGR